MNGIFLCKTPYQILAATRLAMTQYKEDAADIAVFDTISNYQTLLEPLRASGVYRHVYEYHSRDLDLLTGSARRFRPLFYRPDCFWEKPYDFVCFANSLEWVENAIIRAMRRDNPRLSLYWYEDGFSCYSPNCGQSIAQLKSNGLRGLYHRRIYSQYLHLDGMYVFSPELLEWQPECPVFPIEKIGPEDKAYWQAVNGIFGYDHLQDRYEQPCIFFEESYYADGVDVGDVDLVTRLAEEIGKDNLLVKIHPRNPVNRFAQLGFHTNRDTVVPWELIAINIDLEDKLLLTIASGSALTALVNLRTQPRAILMLMDCQEVDETQLTPTLPMLRHLAQKFPELIFLPKDLEQAIQFLRQRKDLL